MPGSEVAGWVIAIKKADHPPLYLIKSPSTALRPGRVSALESAGFLLVVAASRAPPSMAPQGWVRVQHAISWFVFPRRSWTSSLIDSEPALPSQIGQDTARVETRIELFVGRKKSVSEIRIALLLHSALELVGQERSELEEVMRASGLDPFNVGPFRKGYLGSDRSIGFVDPKWHEAV